MQWVLGRFDFLQKELEMRRAKIMTEEGPLMNFINQNRTISRFGLSIERILYSCLEPGCRNTTTK